MNPGIELRRVVEKVSRRFRRLRLLSTLALCWLTWALISSGLYWLMSSQAALWIPSGPMLVALFGLIAATALACVLGAVRAARDPRWVARRIEGRHPDLGAGLLWAVEHDQPSPSGRLGFLQTAVIRQALEHSMANNWELTVSAAKLRGAQLAHAAALAILIAVLVALSGRLRSSTIGHAWGMAGALRGDVQVDPGNTEIERGAALLVIARFQRDVPADASLVLEDRGTLTSRRAMTRGLDDPTFAGRIESVDSDLAYRVEFAGSSTPTYQVKVFEYPELRRTDARLVFPSYTALDVKTVEDIRHVTALEGTEITLSCHLNKDVTTARLVDKDGKVIELARSRDGDHVYQASFTLTESNRYRAQLVDPEGRANKLASEIVVNVTRNQPAVVKVSAPARDVRVSPLEELELKAQLEDDFGVVRHGLSVTMAGREPLEIVLAAPPKPDRKVSARHLVDFESLKAAPDQLLTYFFWAEDIGPDGQPRRSAGDMFFAEVRHFEEIFRQGEQPPDGSAQNEQQQGEAGNAQRADKLAELQKEIIAATWKLVRRETAAQPSAAFVEDAKVLVESQKAVIEQAGELGGRLQDAASKASLEQATHAMNDALKQLTLAAQGPSVSALRPALVAEQAAYQALLKLRAREFQVIRNNSRQRPQGGQASGGSPSDRQLQQLELSADENRYEEQRTAKGRQEGRSQRDQAQQETRQVLNRLHELAQRQTDLNDRLKELQSALEAAKTPQAREELERQLKRLRDQEQQILRDADEVRERMERDENRERMAEARTQMEQSREHVRQASEALEQGRLSQAVTEGTRAGRQINDVRDQLRKAAADRFSDQVTEMRDQARQLDEDQKRLSEQIAAADARPRPGLRDRGERDQMNKGLEQQQQRLEKLMDQMRQTVEDAEQTEPLLARGLFDTIRKATQQKIPDALKVAQQLVGLGVGAEAARSSRLAGQGLEQLRHGVEAAARSVLGDETAALKRAKDELDDLADQVNREIALATDQDPPRPGAGAPSSQPGSPPGRTSGQTPEAEANTEPGPRQANTPRPDQQNQTDAPPAQPGDRPRQAARPGQAGEPRSQSQSQSGEPPANGPEESTADQGNEPGQNERQEGGQGQPSGQGQQARQRQGERAGRNQPPGQPREAGRGQRAGQGQQPGQGLRGSRLAEARENAGGGGGGEHQQDADRLREGMPAGPGGPITGEGYRQWSDRMRDVEELVGNPELRAEAARIRDRARGAREEFKRHSKEPDWTRLKDLIAQPINELRDRIAEEVRRRESPDALIPIDRDPVPPQFAEGVRRYYERLGSGQ